MLQRLFYLRERQTTLRVELTAGITTFMTMAYIIFVNTSILRKIPGLGSDGVAIAAATCLAAAIPTLMMGLFTNTPYALAPGMGLNGVLTFTVCIGNHVPWQTAMGVVCLEGLIIMVLVLSRTREAVMQAIPLDLKRAISVGIGLFIALLGMMNAGLTHVDASAGILAPGSLHDKAVLLGAVGLAITIVLYVLSVRGSLLIGIVITTIIALITHMSTIPASTALLTVPQFTTMFHANILGALQPGMWATILAFVMSDFFDAMGTVIGVGQQAGLVDDQCKMPQLRSVLLVDGFAAMWGGICGTSSATTYIESASGVAEGGRTGLTSVVVGCLFMLALIIAPLVQIVPAQATAPALIIVGFLMLATVTKIDWSNVETAVPAFITIATIPFTYSISRGIGMGFISYIIIMLARRKAASISPILVVVAGLFVVSFVWS